MERTEGSGGNARRLGLAFVMAVWVLLVPVIGFLISSLAAFVAIMAVADHDRPGPRTWAIWTASGVAIVFAFWWIMSDVLLLRVPSGVLF